MDSTGQSGQASIDGLYPSLKTTKPAVGAGLVRLFYFALVATS